MARSGSHKSRSGSLQQAAARGAETRASAAKGGTSAESKPAAPSTGKQDRIAELEAELVASRRALQTQRVDYDADSASFEKTLARLAQSERALSQTKAKLVHAEAAAQAASARVEALETRAAAAEARAAAAEAREQEAVAGARAARFEQAANTAELEELQGRMSDLRAELAAFALRHTDVTAQLSSAEQRIKVLTQERTRLLELMASLDVLGREITQLTNQATAEGAPLPKVEAWLGRDVEAEHVRATVRPEGVPAPAPPSQRAWSTPEIVIDGVKLES